MPAQPRRPSIEFVAATAADFDTFWEWRHRPHVAPWWDGWAPATYEAAREDWMAKVERRVPERGFLVVVGGARVGYIESYRLSDSPELAGALNLDRDAVGADILIGEPGLIGRGLGPVIVGRFYLRLMDETGLDLGVIDPMTTNHRAIRAYEKAGFTHLQVVGTEQIMVADRGTLLSALRSGRERRRPS